jgi:hypothetical protein
MEARQFRMFSAVYCPCANGNTDWRRETVAGAYGEFPVEALLRELSKIPAVKLT